MYKVGVVIVSYNSAEDINDCIKSVLDEGSELLDVLPVVVDNNSSDKSVSFARKSKAVVIENYKNLGFSKAVNIGVKKALDLASTHILILNPDARLTKGSLSSLVRCLDSEESIGAVGPLMIHADGSQANEGYYLKAPSILTVMCFSTLLRPWSLRQKFLLRRYEEQSLTTERSVEQIPGACLLVERKKLEAIGLLDEDFAIWFEDVEWSYRARKKGYLLYFCPDAKVIHEGGVSFAKWEGLDKSVTFYVSMKTFFKKHKIISYLPIVAVLCLNSFVSFIKSRDRNHLRFIKRFVSQSKGILPS